MFISGSIGWLVVGDVVTCLCEWARTHGHALDVRNDVLLFAQGHPCDELFWIERGCVKLLRTEGTGTDVIVGFRQTGTLLGAGASLAATVHPLTARTRTAARVWRLATTTVLDAIDSDSQLRRAVLRSVGMEALDQVARCGALGCLDANEHLKRLLASFIPDSSADDCVRVPLTTAEIAGLLGIDLSHACRLLRAMRRDGLVEISRGRIVIADPSRLDHPQPANL
jgi:CRP/FNR family cyclic AMP-dependent transcriptional regulator